MNVQCLTGGIHNGKPVVDPLEDPAVEIPDVREPRSAHLSLHTTGTPPHSTVQDDCRIPRDVGNPVQREPLIPDILRSREAAHLPLRLAADIQEMHLLGNCPGLHLRPQFRAGNHAGPALVD